MNPTVDPYATIVEDVLKRTEGLPHERIAALIAALVYELANRSSVENNGNAKSEEPDRLIDVEDAATMLSVSKDALYRHPARYKAFTVREGGRLRFSQKGIQRYIARNAGRD